MRFLFSALVAIGVSGCTAANRSATCPALTSDAQTRPAGVSLYGGQDSGADWSPSDSVRFAPSGSGTGTVAASVRFVTTDDVIGGVGCLAVRIEVRESGALIGSLETTAAPRHPATGVYTLENLSVSLQASAGSTVTFRVVAAGAGYSGTSQVAVVLR